MSGTPADPVFIRASSLSGYPDCNRRGAATVFRRAIEAAGYVLRERPEHIGASVGTAVHSAAAAMLKHKAKHGVLCSDSDALDPALEELKEKLKGGYQSDIETPDPGTAEAQVIRMSRLYRHSVAPSIDPIMVEERLEAEVRSGLILTGQSDVIAREPGKVRDLKTGKKLGHHYAQVGAYSLLARSAGVEINAAAIDFVQRVALKKPQPEAVQLEIPVLIAERAAEAVIQRMAEDLRIFKEGAPSLGLVAGDNWAFLPNPSSMLCGAKYCPAHSGGPNGFCHDHPAIKESE